MKMSRPDENKNEHPVVHPIPPVYRADSRILILGSFPSVKSRETGFFWPSAEPFLESDGSRVRGRGAADRGRGRRRFCSGIISLSGMWGSRPASSQARAMQHPRCCAESAAGHFWNAPTSGRFTATGRPRGSITGSTRRSSWDGKRFVFRRRVPRTPHGLWSGCLASGASAEKSYETESDRMKKEYETVWEIFNECANNQMRDVFFDEIKTVSPEAYIRQKFPDKNLNTKKRWKRTDLWSLTLRPPASAGGLRLQKSESRRKYQKSGEKNDREEKHTHVHVLEDGTVIEHSHDHAHGHHHTNTKAVLNRLSRAIGHMEWMRRMVEEGRDCTEVLIQLSAVKAAVDNFRKNYPGGSH